MKYGLIAERIGHSFSPEIHAHLDTRDYELCAVAPSELDAFLKKRDFAAINVTIPYKEAVIPYLHEISPQAAQIGAVNTVVNRDGKLYGYNTDFIGMKALADRIGIEFSGKKVLICGTGGTSKTARAVAMDGGAREIVVVSRTEREGAVTYEEAYELHADAEILINTTPVGMFPNCDGAPVDLKRLKKVRRVLDAVYNPLRTDLVLQAKKRGIRAEGGLYMLVAQGVAASEIFTGRKYPPEMLEKIYEQLLAKRENIVLVGMPACGKSTIGAALAAALGRELYDLDAEIIADAGMPISDIFAREGEAGFRDTETRVLREKVAPLTGAVVATGGGAVLRDENLHLLRRNGRLIFLDRPLDQLLPTEDRPLASSADKIRALYSARIHRYRACADEIIRTDGVVEHAVDAILKKEKNKMKILVLNGPNLNMLGIREPDIYGRETYDDLCAKINAYAAEKGIEVENFQSNHEGALIDKIQEAYFAKVDGIVINAGAYTHTSIALRDALNSVLIPAVEVHISKVHEREYFRRVSYIRDACFMLINGKGTDGYLQAIDALIEKCENK